MASSGLMQIGEVAERTGLSLRTIRYYEEVGLVVPSARSQGGFRLYTADDVDRLLVIKRMKPLDLSLEQVRELLDIVDRLAVRRRLSVAERARLRQILKGYEDAAQTRAEQLQAQLVTVREFAADVAGHLAALEAGTKTAVATSR